MKQVIIDYIKFHVLVKFDDVQNMRIVDNLFSVLKLNKNRFITVTPREGFMFERVYDESTHMRYRAGSSINTKPGVDDFFTFELTGKDCRNFELRGGTWKDLFKYLSENPTELLRCDIAIDDLDGVVPFEEMKDLLLKQHFVSTFRSTQKQVGTSNKRICSFHQNYDLDVNFVLSDVVENLTESMHVYDKTGFTCDFGTKDNLQLEIYDKRVERIVKGSPSNYSQWIRFEMRFGNNKAPVLFPQLNYAIQFDCFNSFACQLLYGMLDFKEGIPKDEIRSHYYRYETPNWYLDFLEVDSNNEKIRIGSKAVYVPTMEKTINWFKNSVSKSVMELIAVDPTGSFLFNVMKEGIAEKLKKGKFDNVSYSKVVNYLTYLNRQADSHEDILVGLYNFATEFIEAGDDAIDFQEVLDRNIERKKVEYERDEETEETYERHQVDYITLDINSDDFEDLLIDRKKWIYVVVPIIGYKERVIVVNKDDRRQKLKCIVTDLEELDDKYETGIRVELIDASI